MNKVNSIQKAISQIGEEGVVKYLPRGMRLHNCHVHGKFLAHYKDKNPLCPLCQQVPPGAGEGTTASEVEHFINLREKGRGRARNRALGDTPVRLHTQK